MINQYKFNSQKEFLIKLEELSKKAHPKDIINTVTPFHVHEAEHLLQSKPSELRFFTLIGALSGFFLSFLFIIFTVLDWPLNTGGKPLISIPAFIIVAFECTILLGGITSFIGFLHLNRLPNLKKIIDPIDCGNQFVIIYHPYHLPKNQ